MHSNTQVYNRQDLNTVPHAKNHVISFGLDAPPSAQDFGVTTEDGHQWMTQGQERWFDFSQMALKGQHNWQNAMAAAALSLALGISRQTIIGVLKSFKALSHRCEHVRLLEGVEWIDDSKGTNVGATLSAILGLAPTVSGKLILIAGGLGKGADFSDLCGPVSKYVKAVILMGEDAPKIAKALLNAAPIYCVNSMSEAVVQAQKLALSGDCVLLSPACASFDMFKDYHHRGEVFSQSVNAL